ncbi:hypothetical protein BN7_782 [Wickerhamomyces ciferrii]|uniref:Enoyl reductase (ER) domain-containing protein n=1 Tax=Wickerhamomyces ciferrii (strain ATCC 14091 / BCRC 22168 / CBS 111 / JCM 3599 / NBRC 0793 / NRRL Y-1031 F-60-10) TaxID=1206466 RepID=K0K8S4_WICCF|nr:uncharacterized protein BN7_782 [Wickerhamomyces ciferrii]CCH41245.1 hypothetical protein BN7_782 [Wickerhamomyces ciferrii]
MSNPSIVLKEKGKIVLENRPVPDLTDERSVKIAVKKTGICGSDVHYYLHGNCGTFVVKAPMVLGHESSGVIAEVGRLVTNVKVGDKVAIEPGVPSRYSEEYKNGRYNLCPDMAFAATPPYDGTLARYYIMPEDFVYKLPDHVSLEEGALVEPLSVAVHAAKRAGIKYNSNVAVFGAGPVGLLTAGAARALGAANVLVVDIFDTKLELAKNIGATHTYNSLKKGNFDEEIIKLIGDRPDIVLEASGADIAMNNGLNLLKTGGVFVQIGMGKDDVKLPVAQMTQREIDYRGSSRYSQGDYNDAVTMIANGKIDVKQLITHRFKFKDAKTAYDNIIQNGKDVVKTIIDGPEDELAKL